MDRFTFEMSELHPGRVKAWLRKILKENEKMNLVTHSECMTLDGKVRSVLIFEDTMMGLVNHLESFIKEEDKEDADVPSIS